MLTQIFAFITNLLNSIYYIIIELEYWKQKNTLVLLEYTIFCLYSKYWVFSIMKAFVHATVLFALLVGIQISCLATMQFSIAKSSAQINKQWIRVRIGAQNGKQPLKYIYDKCPADWKQVYNHIYIPVSLLNSIYLQSSCSIKITDSTSTSLQGTIKFIFNKSKLSLQYPYQLQFEMKSNTGNKNADQKMSPSQQLALFNQLFDKYQVQVLPMVKNVKQKMRVVGNDGKSEVFNTGPKTMDSAVNSLRDKLKQSIKEQLITIQKQSSTPVTQDNNNPPPSSPSSPSQIITQLNNPNIDPNSINKNTLTTVQKLINMWNPSGCEQKIPMLSSILAKLQNHIIVKKEQQKKVTNQMRVVSVNVAGNNKIVEQKRMPINIVNQQIKQVKTQMSALLPTLQSLIQSSQTHSQTLQQKHQQLSTYKATLSQSNIQYLQQLQHLTTIQNNLKQIQNYQQFLSSQIQYFIKLQYTLSTQLTTLQHKMNEIKKQLQKNRESMQVLQSESKRRYEIIDVLKNQLEALEITISTEKTEIITVERIKSEILMKLPELKKNRELQEKIVSSNSLDKIRKFLKTLKTILNDIQGITDVKHYSCNSVRQVTPMGNYLSKFIQNLDPSMDQMIVSFEFPVFEYQKYLKNLYKIDAQNQKSNEMKVRMTPISILDSVWTLAFGYPYIPASFLKAQGLGFKQDFNCLSPHKLQTWVGKILKVQSKMIVIEDKDGKKWNLHLSACSRIQAIKFRPIVGEGIRTRGILRDNNNIEAYRCTCF